MNSSTPELSGEGKSERIRFEVNARRTPNDFADLVLYQQDDDAFRPSHGVESHRRGHRFRVHRSNAITFLRGGR